MVKDRRKNAWQLDAIDAILQKYTCNRLTRTKAQLKIDARKRKICKRNTNFDARDCKIEAEIRGVKRVIARFCSVRRTRLAMHGVRDSSTNKGTSAKARTSFAEIKS